MPDAPSEFGPGFMSTRNFLYNEIPLYINFYIFLPPNLLSLNSIESSI